MYPGNDEADTILARRSSMPTGVGGDADEAGDTDEAGDDVECVGEGRLMAMG